MANVRCDITFRGRVQGVGFRYAAVRVAQGLALSGWVRNEPDGSVRSVVEGEEAEIDRFIAGVEQAMRGHIRDRSVHRQPATGEFRGFDIRR